MRRENCPEAQICWNRPPTQMQRFPERHGSGSGRKAAFALPAFKISSKLLQGSGTDGGCQKEVETPL